MGETSSRCSFSSVADNFPNLNILAVVLTGMGKDGTDGLKSLKEKLIAM